MVVHDELGDRVVPAAAQLRLIAPPGVLSITHDIQSATERAEPSGRYWNREWKAIRDVRVAGFPFPMPSPGGILTAHVWATG